MIDHMRTASLALLLCLALGACASEGNDLSRGDRSGSSTPQRQPTKDQLKSLWGLADAIVVGTVESVEDMQTGRVYKVRVTEVLSRNASLDARKETHPVQEGAVLSLSPFLFKGDGTAGEPTEIGALEDMSRYIFWLSPMDEAGKWLNLEDSAAHRFPEAQPTLDQLRTMRDQGLREATGR
jgi:hypothetical protein